MASLSDAINRAMAYTWDQSHGYEFGGMGNPDFDCSGFVGRCLYEAGFNFPSTHVGTWDMTSLGDNRLQQAGFIEFRYTSHSPIALSSGDIVVLNHPFGDGGHMFFYMENISAYTDPNAYSDNVDIVSKAKIEASNSRGNTNPGDSRRNGTGAYWEVWTHAYNEPFYYGYDPDPDSSDYIHIYKWRNGLWGDTLGAFLTLGIENFKKRRRRL